MTVRQAVGKQEENRNGVETSVGLCYRTAVLLEHVLTNKNTILRLSMPVAQWRASLKERERDKVAVCSSSCLHYSPAPSWAEERLSRRVLVIGED